MRQGTWRVSLAASIRCLTMSTRASAATDWAELPSAWRNTQYEVAKGNRSDVFSDSQENDGLHMTADIADVADITALHC